MSAADVAHRNRSRASNKKRGVKPGVKSQKKRGGSGKRHTPTPPPFRGMGGFIAKEERKLAKARKEGKEATKGQFASISDQEMKRLRKQSRRFDKQAGRITGRLDKIAQREKQAGRRAQERVATDAVSLTTRRSATGARSDARSAGLTAKRGRQARTMAKEGTAQAKAGAQLGRGIAKAGKQALGGMQRTAQRSSGAAMSVLDVLAAQRKADDEMQLTQMRFQDRMARRQHRMQMEYAQFVNDLPMARSDRQSMRMQFRQQEKMALLQAQLSSQGAMGEGGEVGQRFGNDLAGMSTVMEALQSNYRAWAKTANFETLTDNEGWDATTVIETLPKHLRPGAGLLANVIADRDKAVTPQALIDSVIQADETGSYAAMYAQDPNSFLETAAELMDIDKQLDAIDEQRGEEPLVEAGGSPQSATADVAQSVAAVGGVVGGVKLGGVAGSVFGPAGTLAGAVGGGLLGGLGIFEGTEQVSDLISRLAGPGEVPVSARLHNPQTGETRIESLPSWALQKLADEGWEIQTMGAEAEKVRRLGLIVTPFG